ncbi:ABC transporter ATP-binding protein [Vibrio fluvialis]|nr:ABC transporter ATP-binding protein [Vibrio fluvialis]MBY8202537.1 ABC transporter ATP-binding protein [Vibrio fluvialis]MBY8206436.1 ABC transporter ATP-binding protein [Vibrio fluvialis]
MEKIKFKSVTKDYTLHSNLPYGIKGVLLSPIKTLKTLKTSKFRALDNLSFDIKSGEAVALIGKNGAGKSTILSLIAGVMKPTSGSIIVNGSIAPMLELGGGFHFELTGRENIVLNGCLLGFTKKEIQNKIEDIIAFSELGIFIDQPIRTYSSGMLARLGFSIISQMEPDIIIIDEVLAVGDQAFQEKCYSKINEFRTNGATILLVSHNMSDVEKICDRVLWIEDHKIKANGTPEEIVPHYIEY